MIEVDIQVDLGNLLDAFEDIEHFVTHPEIPHEAFTRAAMLLLRSWWGQTFMNQGGRRGLPAWEPLSPGYAVWKLLKYGHARAMILSGDLQASPEIINRTGNTLFWGTRKSYAEYQHAGTRYIPARSLITITQRDISELQRFLVRYMTEYFESKGII
jgi:hypothetical protein